MQLYAKVLPLLAIMVSNASWCTTLQFLSRLPMIFSALCHGGHSATPIYTAS